MGVASDNKKHTGQSCLGGSELKMEVPGNGLLSYVNPVVHFLFLMFRRKSDLLPKHFFFSFPVSLFY